MVSDSSKVLLKALPHLAQEDSTAKGRSVGSIAQPGKLAPARRRNGDKSELLSEINATELNAELKMGSSASTNTWIEKCGGLDPKPRG